MRKNINKIDKKLLKWLVDTYINETWINYNDLHIDEINKKVSITNLSYWIDILKKLTYYRDVLSFNVSICLNIGLKINDSAFIYEINTIEKAIDHIDLSSVPSYYLIGKGLLNSFIEDKVKVINDNIAETIFTSSYKNLYAENNEVTNILSIISFTPIDYIKFKRTTN